MPLDPEVRHVVPAPGMKQGIEARLAPEGTLTYAQNVRFEKLGRVAKRGGTERIGTNLPAATVAGSWIHENFACVDDQVYAYDEPRAAWRTGNDAVGIDPPFTPVGRYPAVLTESGTTAAPAIAVLSSTVVIAYANSLDVTTSSIFIVGFSLDGELLWRTASFSGGFPRLVTANGVLYLSWLTSGGKVQARTVSATGSTGSVVDLTASSAAAAYDAAPLEGSNDWVIAYVPLAGTTITAARVSGTTVTATRNVTSGAAVSAVGVAGGGATNDSIWVAFRRSGRVDYEALKWDLSATWMGGGPVTVTSTGARGQPSLLRVDATHAIVATGAVLTPGSSSLPTTLVVSALLNNTGTVSGLVKSHGWLLASKLWPSPASYLGTGGGAGFRARFVARSILTQRHAIVEATATDVAAIGLTYERPASALLVLAPDEHLTECSIAAVGSGDGNAFTALLWDARQASTTDPSASLSAAMGIDFIRVGARQLGSGVRYPSSAARQVHKAPFGAMHYVAGGAGLVEAQPVSPRGGTGVLPMNGFALIPRIAAHTTGPNVSANFWTYVATYEHLDSAGQRCQSEPSASLTVRDDFGGTIEGTVPGGTCRPSVTLHLWRSKDGGPYHRVTPDAGAPLCTDVDARATGDFVTFSDSMTDADAATREELDVISLPPAPPSGAGITCAGGGRMFATDWMGRVWVSKLAVPGEPFEFVDDDAFRIFPPERPTGLAVLDGTLAIFGERGIYALPIGFGPSDQGQNPYDVPSELLVDDGCINPRSVVATSAGILYQARRGLMVLPRGLGSPQYLEDVADELAARPVILSAAKSARPDGSELVHFALAETEAAPASNARLLVVNVQLGAWSVDALPGSIAALGTRSRRLALMTGGATPNVARWMPEDGALFSDVNDSAEKQWIEMRLRFAQLRPFGIAGAGRFERMVALFEALGGGATLDDLKLTIESTLDEGLDVDEQPEAPAWQVPDDLKTTGVAVGKAMYFHREFKRKGPATALGLEFFDAAPDGDTAGESNAFGAGFVFHGFSIELRPEFGLRRVPREMQK